MDSTELKLKLQNQTKNLSDNHKAKLYEDYIIDLQLAVIEARKIIKDLRESQNKLNERISDLSDRLMRSIETND